MRCAAIDVGTNSVLLLVAERRDGRFEALVERASITRLGRGVDVSKELSVEAMNETLAAITAFANEARQLGAERIVVSATSAARDAKNGGEFIARAKREANVDIEIISGDEEARLSFASAFADFGSKGPIAVVDIGGGSTEIIVGDATGNVSFRHSFDVGSVRLTERLIKSDPPSAAELAAVDALLQSLFQALPKPAQPFTFVGVAGTVTTVAAVSRGVAPYDAAKIHGAVLSLSEVSSVARGLAVLPLSARRNVPGLQPKRADVIVAGARVLEASMRAVGVDAITVSDKGLRWGLLVDRFGKSA